MIVHLTEQLWNVIIFLVFLLTDRLHVPYGNFTRIVACNKQWVKSASCKCSLSLKIQKSHSKAIGIMHHSNFVEKINRTYKSNLQVLSRAGFAVLTYGNYRFQRDFPLKSLIIIIKININNTIFTESTVEGKLKIFQLRPISLNPGLGLSISPVDTLTAGLDRTELALLSNNRTKPFNR